MRVRIYFTRNNGPRGTIPVLYLPDDPEPTLPEHPMHLEWQYLATMDISDPILVNDRSAIADAFGRGQHYLSLRLPL